MKLKDWQKLNKRTDIDVAREMGVHPSYISHLNAGRRRPSPEMAAQIERITGGRVSRIELLYPNEN